MKYRLHAVVLAAVCGCTGSARSTGAPFSDRPLSQLEGWQLAWFDEFDLPDGSPVDSSKWTHQVGGDGGWNEELQYYTEGTDNAEIRGGALVITATSNGASAHSCWYGPCRYTSARLITKGKFEQQYGRIEARIRVPAGKGLWPAFWLLGANMDNVGWPQCGEIDVMENVGHEPHQVYGSLHGEGYSGENGLITGRTVPGAPLSEGFHRFAVEWDAEAIRFYADDVLYSTRTPADVPQGSTWAFDHSFYLLLNVAVGGTWPGDPDENTHFPQTMQVDWVRAYVKS